MIDSVGPEGPVLTLRGHDFGAGERVFRFHVLGGLSDWPARMVANAVRRKFEDRAPVVWLAGDTIELAAASDADWEEAIVICGQFADGPAA